MLQQEADLTPGQVVLRTMGLVCVTAPTLDELDAAVAAIEQAAIQTSCEVNATRRAAGAGIQRNGITALSEHVISERFPAVIWREADIAC